MNITENSIVGEVVAQNYHAASIFKERGIDFCCKGGRTIAEVCQSKNIDSEDLIKALHNLAGINTASAPDYRSWDTDLLVDYIEKKHHRYVEKAIPELKAYLDKIAKVHGDKHPELHEINTLFNASAGELLSHMKKEENILFPFIRRMTSNEGGQTVQPPFGSINNPISVMHQEHENEGERFRRISELSDHYTPPEGACTTYKVAFALLQEFEEDLHLHIHLENNILFPRAIELENAAVNA